ncbi:MAG: hypothetical protein ACRCWG_13420 [Sarcina sp.]
MFTKSIKQSTKSSIRQNAEGRYLPGILFVIIPFIIYFALKYYIASFGSTVAFVINIILLAIIQYLAVWFSVFGTKVMRERVSFGDAIPRLNLFKAVIIPIIITAILLSIINSYGYMLDGFVRGLVGMIGFIIPIYLILVVVSYVIDGGSVDQKRVLKALPEYLWRFIVLVITFIPLGLLICITLGILGFWKVTYIDTAFRVLGVSVYEKYSAEEKIPTKHLVGGIIAVVIFFICGASAHNTAPIYQSVYKVNAYNGQEYDFVVQNNKIMNIRFDSLNSLENGPMGVEKNIMFNGQKSGIDAVFNEHGQFLGLTVQQSNEQNLGSTNLNEILKGAENYSKGSGFSLVSVVVQGNNKDKNI